MHKHTGNRPYRKKLAKEGIIIPYPIRAIYTSQDKAVEQWFGG